MKKLSDIDSLQGKKVLLRADFNVPLDGTIITDDGRIKAALPTIKELLKGGAKIIITAHLGRPKGQVKLEFSLAPVAKRLSELVDAKVTLAKDLVGEDAHEKVSQMQDGEIVILENVRFDARETSKDEKEREDLAKQLTDMADVFVSDGFGVVHRKQASVYDVAKFLPAYAGLLIQKEIDSLSRATENPVRPLTVILGGSKVSDKLGVIENLLTKADKILIGGGMSYTFLYAMGYEVGTSLLEKDQADKVREYMETAKERNIKLVLPVDTVVSDEVAPDSPHEIVDADKIPAERGGVDIGTKTRELFAKEIADSKTVVWNGPMGVFEMEAFADGTKAVAEALVKATENGTFSIIGGGDSAAAVRKFGYSDDDFSHISTGGGASLEFLEGKTLPGLSVLE